MLIFILDISALVFYTSANGWLYSSVISVPLKLRYLNCFYQTTVVCLVSIQSHIICYMHRYLTWMHVTLNILEIKYYLYNIYIWGCYMEIFRWEQTWGFAVLLNSALFPEPSAYPVLVLDHYSWWEGSGGFWWCRIRGSDHFKYTKTLLYH